MTALARVSFDKLRKTLPVQMRQRLVLVTLSPSKGDVT
jgi:hypothetical protein